MQIAGKLHTLFRSARHQRNHRRPSVGRWSARPVTLLLLALAGLPAAMAAWQWQEPLPQGNALRAMAWGHDQYVAVGDAGTVLASADGQSWQSVSSDLRTSLHALTFGDGVFVAVGDQGVIARSTDGVTWTVVRPAEGESLYHVTHGDHGFITAGGLTLLKSADGQHWTSVEVEVDPGPFPPSLGGAAYGNGHYVVPLNGDPFSTEPAQLLVSDDLESWQMHVINQPEGNWGSGPLFFRGLAFGQGHFVAAANRFERAITFRSNDGVTWEWFDAPVHNGWTLHLKSLTYDAANERFIGLSNPNDPPPSPDLFPSVLISEDGGAWSHLIDLVGSPIQPIRFVHDRLFGLTQFGEIHDSPDGTAWNLRTGGARAWRFQDLLHTGEAMLAVGEGPAATPGPLQEREAVVLRSVSGDDWTPVTLPAPDDAVVRQILAAVAGDGHIVLAVQESVGMLPMPIQRQWALYVSTNGLDWQRTDLDEIGNFNHPNAGVRSAAYGDGTFLISASDGTDGPVMLYSTDHGKAWKLAPPAGTGDAQPGTMIHDGTGFVALPYGFGTDILRSTDGINWTPTSAWDNTGGSLQDIAHLNGTYLIVASAWVDGAPASWLLRSTDGGDTWQDQRFESHSLGAISRIDRQFVLGASGGEVLLSVNGVDWAASWTGAQAFATAAQAGGDARIWIVTQGGGLLERGGDKLFQDRFEQPE